MADVVHIRDRLERMPRRTAKPFQDAQILLFTGVRYERIELSGQQPPAKKARKNKAQPASSH